MELEKTIPPEQTEEKTAEPGQTENVQAAETSQRANPPADMPEVPETAPAVTEAESGGMDSLCITVDDGSQRIPIRNKQGQEIGAFFFRPTDIGIVDRFNNIAERFNEVTEPLEAIQLKQDGTVDVNDPAAVQALEEAKQRLFTLCDYLFGGNLSEAFFGSMHPFSPVNGAFYCENVITSVGNFISKQFDRETVKINKRMEKYMPSGNRESRRRR